jgi:hypothetical protein
MGRSQATCPLWAVAAGVALTPRAAVGISRPPPQYRHAAPMPAGEIALAAVAFAGLLAFGFMLAWLWNRWNAREPQAVEKIG